MPLQNRQNRPVCGTFARAVFSAFFLFLCLSAVAQNSLPAVGAWREHLPYGSTIAVAATDTKFFCATLYSLFSVVPESGETGVGTLSYDAILKKLVIAYSNSNIDVLGANNKRRPYQSAKRQNWFA